MTMTLTQSDLKQIGQIVHNATSPILEAIQVYSIHVGAELQAIKIDIRELKADVAEFKADVAHLKTEVRNLREDMTAVQQRLTQVEQQLILMTDRIETIDRRDHEDTTAALSDIVDLRKRVKRLEKEQHILKQELNSLQ